MTYQKTLKEYEQEYGVSRRTVQRWKQKELPLDDPEAMRLHAVSAEDSDDDSEREPIPRPTGTGPLGLRANIVRLQEAERDAHAGWQEAIKYGDEAVAARRHREWLLTSEQLKKVELATPDVQEANKQSVTLSELHKTLGELEREKGGRRASRRQRKSLCRVEYDRGEA